MKILYEALRGRVFAGVVSASLAGLACDPGAFSHIKRHDTAGSSGSEQSGSGGESGADGPPSDAGQDPVSDGGEQAGTAAVGGSGAGTGGRAGAAGQAGASGTTGHAGAGGTAGHAGAGGTAGHAGAGGTAGHAGAGGTAGHAGAAGAGGQAGMGACTSRSTLSAVKITPTELGVLSVPAELDEVSTGPAVLIHDRVLWLLGTRAQSAFQGRPIVVTVSPGNLQKHAPLLDAQTNAQLVFPDEPADASTSVTPTSAWLAADGGSVQYYFSRFYVFSVLGVGLAQSTLQAPSAKTLVASDSLFPKVAAPDGGTADPFRPLIMSAGVQRTGVQYTYMCHAKPSASEETDSAGAHYQPCRVGRVPAQQVSDGARYQFWDGTQWQADFTRSSVVVDHVTSGLSVEYNAYLDKYLAVHSGSDDTIVLKWATAPQGPFETLGQIDTAKGTGTLLLTVSFGAREVVGLRQNCDRTLFVTYSVPLQDATDSKVVHLETHVMRVDLN
jgi:hypothetical protein